MDCKDKNCPEHGTLATRGVVLEGTVVSDKMQSTVIVKRERFVKILKFNKYRKSTSKIPAHNPPCIAAKTGDKVRIMECRKLSRTKNFVVVEVLGNSLAVTKEKKAKPKAKKTVKKVKGVSNG